MPVGAPPTLESGATGRSRAIGPGYSFASITDKISSIVLTHKTPRGWWFGFALSFLFIMGLLYTICYLLITGVGIWGVNVPVAWGFAIVNFVWWIGIGHAGTLISAILLLLHQHWRTSINRFAEAMTLFAVACAGLFPLLHLGRPWFFYWLFPYPNTMNIWPQFRSPLVWDVFAVLTYFTVSLLFWYVGLIPDFATIRDRTKSRFGQVIYGILAMGWRGSAHHWHRYDTAYLILAGLATPLVVSVHTVVSFDFAVANLPGWHSTIFPPYFVAGAIFSGFAMVLVLAIPLRKFYGLQDFITTWHLENMGKIMLVTGLMVGYGYFIEAFMAWIGTNKFEAFAQLNRMVGPYAPAYWALIACNVLAPQILWVKRWRRNSSILFIVSLIVLLGMWLERYVIVITSLHRDFLPSSWGMYSPTIWDWTTFLGTLGLFFGLLFLFIRFLPMISIFEMRTLLPEAQVEEKHEPAAFPNTETPAQPVAMSDSRPHRLYGMLAEFATPQELVQAARAARAAGYFRMDAFSPFAIEGLSEVLRQPRTRLPYLIFLGGLLGGLGGFFLQYWCMAVSYPLNIGGRPLNSWPSFIPVTFELTVLCASLTAVIGMLGFNGLPMPYHPVFNAPRFSLVTNDRFFLLIEARDPQFDPAATRQFLADFQPHEVTEVLD